MAMSMPPSPVRRPFVELADHAEVDEPDPAVRLDEEVAGVRIGVEGAVLEDHLQNEARGAFGERQPVDARRVERRPVVDLDPADALERQHAAAASLPEHRGNVHRRVVHEVARETLGVVCLAHVVELGPDGARELLGQADQIQLARALPAPARRDGETPQDLEVALDLLDHSGPSHIHDDLGPVVEARRVGLADRRRSDRRRVEGREEILERPPQLGLDDRADRREGLRRHLVLELRQLARVVGWEEVGARRGDLAGLHCGRAQVLERHPQVLGARVGPRPARVAEEPAMERHEALEADDPHDVTEAMPKEDTRDLPSAVPPLPRRGRDGVPHAPEAGPTTSRRGSPRRSFPPSIRASSRARRASSIWRLASRRCPRVAAGRRRRDALPGLNRSGRPRRSSACRRSRRATRVPSSVMRCSMLGASVPRGVLVERALAALGAEVVDVSVARGARRTPGVDRHSADAADRIGGHRSPP